MEEAQKWMVPILVVAYGDDEREAVKYVEEALDNTWFVREDGVYSAEVFDEDVERMEEET